MKSPAQCLLWGLLASLSQATHVDNQHQKPLNNIQTDQQPTAAPSYRSPLIALHRSLVTIPSISGDEVKVANHLVSHLRSRNFTSWLQTIPETALLPKRYNVLARPPSSSPSSPHHLLLTSHIDVVPPYIPYHISAPNPQSITPDTKISGRGSVDAKASVASQIIAVEELISSQSISPDSILLLYVVGEETTGDGMRFFSSSSSSSSTTTNHNLTAAIFGEPTENKLACGHKGITFGKITARGKAGHSGYPWLGKSATEVLIHALNRILNTDFGSSERYGNTTVNVGRIEGGVAANVIPKFAEADLSVRIAVGNQSTGADIVREKIKGILEEFDGEEALSLESLGGYGPVECFCDVDGFDTMVANYGTDVPHLVGDHASYLYGPGSILVAHGDDEGLRVGDLEEAVEGYKKLIKHVLEV